MHSIENQSQQERVNQIANLKEQVQTVVLPLSMQVSLPKKLLPFLK